jgi:cytochrome P450
MSHSFSTASLMGFESSFDIHLTRLARKINDQNGRVFNLKDYLACYAFDIIGQLAFDTDLGTLDKEPSLEKLSPIPDHIWVACLFGMMPSLLPYSMKIGNRLPIPGLRRLLLSRKALASQTTDYVMEAIKRHKNGAKDTLLSSLLEATDPETGTALTSEEVCSEAFALL